MDDAVAPLEETLLLHEHQRGTLVALDRYLHDRTGGMIGALSHAIRGDAIDAILTGTEKITKKTSRRYRWITPPRWRRPRSGRR